MKLTNKFPVTALFILYLGILVKFILFKRPVEVIRYCLKNLLHLDLKRIDVMHANYVPFKTVLHYLSGAEGKTVAVENVLGNFIGFIPLGLLVPLLSGHIKTMKSMLVVSFFTSFSFEVIQLITGLGFFDVDDLILNTAGGALGFFVMEHFYKQTSALNPK